MNKMDEFMRAATSGGGEVVQHILGTFKETTQEAEYIWTVTDVLPKHEGVVIQRTFKPELCKENSNWTMFLKHSPKASVPIIVSLINHGISSCKVTPTVTISFLKKESKQKLIGSITKDTCNSMVVGDWEIYEIMFKREDRDIPNFHHLLRKIEYSVKLEVTMAYNVLENNPLDKGKNSRLGPFVNFARALMDNGELANLEIKTKDATYFVQKEMLTLRSEVFFNTYKMRASPNLLVIEDVNSEAVYDMLCYLYTGKIKNIKKHIYDLLTLADRFQIMTLKNMCEEVLIKDFTIANIKNSIMLIERYKLNMLKEKITNFIVEAMSDTFKREATPNIIQESVLAIYNIMALSKN